MSIAVLTQVYDEARRLAIAGSMVAGGDFRLKKLVPTLEQIGAKAPVFAKVAEAAKAVVDSKEQASAPALLELATLVSAILYTQGETGAPGALEPIETVDLGAAAAQVSARTLKPLLEALTTTGSGRFELIREAHEQGAFRDLRLVKPALDALDDSYGEISEFIAEKVLPLYGKAILPDLRARFDLKGRGGHPRRLRLLHALDPASARDIVKQALDSGSKEMKVVAVECLGAAPDDLSYLLEQAAAKAADVRQAAYRALATIDDDAAVAALQKALGGKDLGLAAAALPHSRNAKLLKHVIAEAGAEIAALPTTKDKQERGERAHRALLLIESLAGRDDRESEAFLLKLFAQRDELAKIKGIINPYTPPDFNSAVVHVMERGSKKLRTALVDAHASLPAPDLWTCFQTARRLLPADKLYALFSPYLTAKVDEQKKQPDQAWAKREAILDGLGVHKPAFNNLKYRPTNPTEEPPPLDPRWLDLAVRLKDLPLVTRLIRPGHSAANAFLAETFRATFAKAKQLLDCQDVVLAMIQAQHPEAPEAYLAVLEKFGKKTDYYGYFVTLIADLPKSAIPRLEALVPNLSEKMSDTLLEYIQKLRDKP
jgi:hypothetical protein